MNREIRKLRAEIDEIDDQMTLLFLRRMAVVSEIMEEKRKQGAAVEDKAREQEILSRLAARFSDKEKLRCAEQFLSALLSLSKNYQYRQISKRPIVLIGFMGTGKTKVGKILAERLSSPYEEIDVRIEKEQQRSISKIFEEEGEEGFRKLEKETIEKIRQEISDKKRQGDPLAFVISCGGGAVLLPENVRNLRAIGSLVLLTAKAEVITERLTEDNSRPLLQGKNLQEISELMKKRETAYLAACPDICVDTSEKSPQEVAGEILARLC